MSNNEQSHKRDRNREHEEKREDDRDGNGNSTLADISALDSFLQAVLWMGEAIVRLIAAAVVGLTSS